MTKSARFLQKNTKKSQKIPIFLPQISPKPTQTRHAQIINKMRKLRKYHLRYATHERNGFTKTPGTGKNSKNPGNPKKTNHRPTARIKTRTSKKHAKSSAALKIRSFCVRGSTSFQTKTQTAMIIHNRKTNEMTLTNIPAPYPF
jgi:hypothetical protein